MKNYLYYGLHNINTRRSEYGRLFDYWYYCRYRGDNHGICGCEEHGLKLDDINPKASHQNKALQAFVMIGAPIAIAIVWPYQVYVWFRRIVKHYTV